MSNSARIVTNRRSSGFTLVEIAAVVLVVGILAALAIPRTRQAITGARATAVLSDMRTARLALFEYFFENNRWPPPASPGQVPAGLSPFLPDQFTFEGPYARLDYVNLGGDVPGLWGRQVGLTAWVEDDPRLRTALASMIAANGPEPGDQAVALGVQTGEVEPTGN